MGRWKIELEPSSPQSSSGPSKSRYRVLRPGSLTPLLLLDEQETKDLADALGEALKPAGQQASERAEGGPRRVSVQLAKQRVRIRAANRTVKLAVNEAGELLDALAHTFGRTAGPTKMRPPASVGRATPAERPAAWQCSRCMGTASASAPQSPPVVGCVEGGQHDWMRGGVLRLVEAVQQSLPGHTVSLARDADEAGRCTTSCRVEDAKGQPVGVAVVTDDYAASASLDRIEARASEVARLLKVLRAYGDAPSRYVEVNERGIRIRLR
jgi:hypothetical protein